MEKLLVFATLGRKAYGKWLFQRMLERAVLLIGVTRAIVAVGIIFIIAILLSALLIGLLLGAYTALVHGGLSPSLAMLIISIATLLIIGMLVLLAQHFIRQLPRMLAPQSHITARINDTINAFLDGFMEK